MSRISVATSKTVVRGSGVSVARAVSRSRACASGLASDGGGRGIDGAGEADEAGVHKRAEAAKDGSMAVAEGWASGTNADVTVDAKVEDGK